MYSVLAVAQVFICAVLVLLILLHSGKDSGMSGAFGVGVAGGQSRWFADGAQPDALDDRVRRAVRGQHARPTQDLTAG